MNFKFIEDEIYFKSKLHDLKEETFKTLFDFSNPTDKRKNFNKDKKTIFNVLSEIQKEECLLEVKGVCDKTQGFQIDHIIPLSTNILNKELRDIRPKEKGRKVQSESYGSNHMNNLILVCKPCNQHKKHRLLNKEDYQEIFRKKAIFF